MTFPTIIGMTAFGLAFLAFAAVYWRIRQASFKAPQVPAHHFAASEQIICTQDGMYRCINGEWVPFEGSHH